MDFNSLFMIQNLKKLELYASLLKFNLTQI